MFPVALYGRGLGNELMPPVLRRPAGSVGGGDSEVEAYCFPPDSIGGGDSKAELRG